MFIHWIGSKRSDVIWFCCKPVFFEVWILMFKDVFPKWFWTERGIWVNDVFVEKRRFHSIFVLASFCVRRSIDGFRSIGQTRKIKYTLAFLRRCDRLSKDNVTVRWAGLWRSSLEDQILTYFWHHSFINYRVLSAISHLILLLSLRKLRQLITNVIF